MITKSVLLLTICLFLCLCVTAEAASPPPDAYMVKPNCRYRCGGVVIPFPFGIGESCYLNEWYSVICSSTSNNISSPGGAERAFLNHTKLNLELLNVSTQYQTVTVNSPIASYNQREGLIGNSSKSVDLEGSPFLFSRLDNIFVVLGCGHGKLMDDNKKIRAGCTSVNCSRGYYTGQGCYGINCCQATIPAIDNYYLNSYSVNLSFTFTPDDDEGSTDSDSNSTTHAFLVDRYWFSGNFSRPDDVEGVKYYAPLALFWIIKEGDSASSICNHTAGYSPRIGSYLRYGCSCPVRYEGNPYLSDGCHGTHFFLIKNYWRRYKFNGITEKIKEIFH